MPLQPLSQAILFEAFPPAEYGMAMALFGIGVMVGPILGPVLGGWITDNWSWNWIFYINIPIGIISVIIIMLFIKDPDYLKRVKEKIDYWGLALIVLGIGCLQVILDKGQREDWFSSAFIIRLSIIAIISLILFVIVELKVREPVLNLRQFKNLSFTSANIIQCASFFVLFATILLLPMFLQQLMGYNAFLSGLALAPGGIATLFSMPLAGKLITKFNPKAVLVSGLFITAYSVFIMSGFNLYIDFDTVGLSRIIMGFGLGLVFVPLTSMAFSTVAKEHMGNATSIFNLLRNISGSFGVAIMTTLVARKIQFHQFRLTEQLNPLDYHYQIGMYKAKVALESVGSVSSNSAAHGIIYQQLMRQANLLSFNDAFYFSTIILLCVIPVVLLLKQHKNATIIMGAH